MNDINDVLTFNNVSDKDAYSVSDVVLCLWNTKVLVLLKEDFFELDEELQLRLMDNTTI
jgi:hypothetical protein